MRKKFNRNAICSVNGNSGSYEFTHKAHKNMLQEKHEHFSFLQVSGEIAFDVPTVKDGKFQPKFKTIRIFGKEMRLTVEEYNTHYLKAELK